MAETRNDADLESGRVLEINTSQELDELEWDDLDLDDEVLQRELVEELKLDRGPLIRAAELAALTNISLDDLKDAVFAGRFPAPPCFVSPARDKPQTPEILWEPAWFKQDVIEALPRTKAWLAARTPPKQGSRPPERQRGPVLVVNNSVDRPEPK